MTNPQRKPAGLRSGLWLVEPAESNPHERRRSRPYYHRHESRQQATWLDWLAGLALASVIALAIEWAGAWPA